MEMGGKQHKKIMLKRGVGWGGNSGPSCTERRRRRKSEGRKEEEAVGRVQRCSDSRVHS